jgi:peptidyl-prolyl cis-trans isomerase SurA
VIYIKKIIFLIFITFVVTGKTNGAVNDSIYMTVGNKPVTQSDIVNEIKMLLILNNESYSNDRRDELQELAVKTIVKRLVKQKELERNNFFQFNQKDLKAEVIRLATIINVDLETLENILTSNLMDITDIEDHIKVELAWNSLIFEIYKNRILINPESIEKKLKILENEKIEEFLISEIVLGSMGDDQLAAEIKNIFERIKIEGFENVAKTSSLSKSAEKGGDIGWVNKKIISQEVQDALSIINIGDITKPIILPEGILLFKIRDKRVVKSTESLEDKKNKLVTFEKTKMLRMYSLSHYDKVRRATTITFLNND